MAVADGEVRFRMFGVFDPAQRLHQPAREFFGGDWAAHADTAARVDAIVAALPPLAPAVDHGEAPLRAVHTAAYLDFLRTIHARWRAEGRAGDAIGYAWPRGRPGGPGPRRLDALLGRHGYDSVTPIGPHSWDAAYAGAQTALTALTALLAGRERHAFALCRPPGHHAGHDYCGGYCYLNHAGIAGEAAVRAGRRVAVLDIDYHHGNGTQDLFWTRGDVLFASLHADPATDYPYFWGHADEVGEGAGRGATLNLPLPAGTGLAAYRPALDRALAAVAAHGADLLVVSFGADTFAGDPISRFALGTADFPLLGGRIAAAGLATLVVMEGGYAVDALGRNVAGFLGGFG